MALEDISAHKEKETRIPAITYDANSERAFPQAHAGLSAQSQHLVVIRTTYALRESKVLASSRAMAVPCGSTGKLVGCVTD
jgi:hypothetical protein